MTSPIFQNISGTDEFLQTGNPPVKDVNSLQNFTNLISYRLRASNTPFDIFRLYNTYPLNFPNLKLK